MRIGPKFKIARRLGEKIFPKTQTTKFAISGSEKRQPKGKGGRRGGATEFATQLLEKQKAKYTYGVNEKQFANYVKGIKTLKQTTPSAGLYQALESRLDNIVYRLAWTPSRQAARQAVSHGHILLNGRKNTVPSSYVRPGDKISIRPASKDKGAFRGMEERQKEHIFPLWLTYDPEGRQAQITATPTLKEKESTLNFEAIIEFYSRV